MEFMGLFLVMLFMHTIADYNLQGWLAQAKQRKWWDQNCPGKKYQYDWSCALVMHCLQWTFLVMLPLLVCVYLNPLITMSTWMLMFAINFVIHFMTDDAKANLGLINLWQDQLIHIGQIALTAMYMI